MNNWEGLSLIWRSTGWSWRRLHGETAKPHLLSCLHWSCTKSVQSLGTSSLPSAGATSLYTETCPQGACWWRQACCWYDWAGQTVRQIRLSQDCSISSEKQVGQLATAVLSGSGDKRGWRFHRTNRRKEGSGWMTAHAFSRVLSIATMSGAMTSFIAETMTAKFFDH